MFEYIPNFINNTDELYDNLMKEIPFEQRTVTVYGKTYNEPRLTSIHGDNSVLNKEYIYSRSIRELLPMTPTLVKLQNEIELKTGIHYDFVLLNLYRDGNDKVSWHSDDEPMMDCSNIASISLGTPRIFKFRNKETKEVVWKNKLEDGSFVWMKQGCQETLEHEVPKEPRITKPRINLTFRRFKN
jgi:alkylated DNA repair dioxygenase AlkB